MKLYLIQWGFHSSNDGGCELDSIWTNKIWAKKYFRNKAKEKDLEKSKRNPSDDYYTDGDYWTSLSEINSDTEWMYGEPDVTSLK